MANPTTNYGFVLPTATDLVTDLPADFDVALQGVDTRLKALQPGTTLGDLAYSSATANTNTRLPVGTNGQVLAVVAGVPAWQNGTTGDIEGVTAGVGISGGGTSGTVTVTNDMATTITASGDIVVGTGSGTYDNLPIGTTGQILTADTTVSPYKVKWATLSTTPTFKGVRLVNSGSQLIANSTTTAVTWDTERIDTDAFHSTSSNTSRITIPTGLGGYYNVFGSFVIKKGAATSVEIFLYKNGSEIGHVVVAMPSTTVQFTQLYYTGYFSLAATDYIELYARQNAGEDRPLMGNNEFLDGMYFQANLIGV